jgi:CheY-like chemotaxis protein
MSFSEPLSTLMADGPMPVLPAVRIARDLAGVLQEVHGELWPSAIAVTDDGVGILPPGLGDRNRWGQYAAPERLLGRPATPASDVFSIAAILFHALAGRPPFRGDSASELMLAVCADLPLDLYALRPDVPKDLAALVGRCLARDASQRPATPLMLKAALDGFLRGAPAWPGKRMLAADDDAPIRELYAHVAAEVGVEADVVSGGRDAISAMKARRYDIALLDLNMPRLSGWEVLDFIRPRYESQPRHLFIVTGYADQNVSAADRDLVRAVLYKPVSTAELRTLVTAVLGGGDIDVASILRTTSHRITSAA